MSCVLIHVQVLAVTSNFPASCSCSACLMHSSSLLRTELESVQTNKAGNNSVMPYVEVLPGAPGLCVYVRVPVCLFALLSERSDARFINSPRHKQLPNSHCSPFSYFCVAPEGKSNAAHLTLSALMKTVISLYVIPRSGACKARPAFLYTTSTGFTRSL